MLLWDKKNMVLLRINFGRNQGKNTVELANISTGKTTGPIDVGERIPGDNRKFYLVAYPNGSFSGTMGVIYKSANSSQWIYHRFLEVGSKKTKVSVEYHASYQYDGPFFEDGHLTIYFLTSPMLTPTIAPIPSISTRGLIKAKVPIDVGADAVHIHNLPSNDTAGCWVGGYYPKITSNAPSCFVTYQYDGTGVGIVLELFGNQLSDAGYKVQFGASSTINSLVSAEVDIENIIDYGVQNEITASINRNGYITSRESIITKKYSLFPNIPNAGFDTNFACVQWNIDISNPPRPVIFNPGNISKLVSNTMDNYTSISSSSGARYKISSVPQKDFLSGFS